MALCGFMRFESLDHALLFAVLDATPEREDGVIGELPNGTLVHEDYVEEDGECWLVADTIRLLDDNEAVEGRKALDAAPHMMECI